MILNWMTIILSVHHKRRALHFTSWCKNVLHVYVCVCFAPIRHPYPLYSVFGVCPRSSLRFKSQMKQVQYVLVSKHPWWGRQRVVVQRIMHLYGQNNFQIGLMSNEIMVVCIRVYAFGHTWYIPDIKSDHIIVLIYLYVFGYVYV